MQLLARTIIVSLAPIQEAWVPSSTCAVTKIGIHSLIHIFPLQPIAIVLHRLGMAFTHAPVMGTAERWMPKKNSVWKCPWAAPGKAQLWSPCGINGGHETATGYDKPWDGRDLPPTKQVPADSKWVMGQTAQVAFALTKHHGGGYQWRLCPGSSTSSHPSDACFQAHPLTFASENTIVRWTTGRTESFRALEVNGSMVTPPNYPWRVIQIPITSEYKKGTRLPPCPDCHGHWGIDGDDIRQEWEFSLLDTVHVPTNVPAGPAWLQWRWDNEQQDQVWTSCADIVIVAGGPSPAPPSPPPPAPPSPSPTGSDVMSRGATLTSGQKLVSHSGNAWFQLQGDGTLVLMDAQSQKTLWRSKTASSGSRFIFQQTDGNLVLRDSSGNSKWSSGVLPTAASAKIQDDCNFVVRDKSGQALWSTKTSCSHSMIV